MSTETEDTCKRSVAEIASEYDGHLEVTVTSDSADTEPLVVLSLNNFHPYYTTSLIVSPVQARQIGEMLIEHAERVTGKEQ